MRSVDRRYAGTALGVGKAKIIGRIHAIDMQIANQVLILYPIHQKLFLVIHLFTHHPR